ncbi:MAG: hypothetical protein IT510_07915 [Sulfuritalea sp.]|jgi:hypothetical protein|nr:hypothetical protein [Sulfuritalea sp.]
MARPNSKMLPKDLIAFIENGIIEKITISRSSPVAAWSVSAYGRALPADAIAMIELNLEGCQRLWADLDAAYSFIRKCGFHDHVLIEG